MDSMSDIRNEIEQRLGVFARQGAKAAFDVASRVAELRGKMTRYLARGGSWDGIERAQPGLSGLVGDIINNKVKPTDAMLDIVFRQLNTKIGGGFSRPGAKAAFQNDAEIVMREARQMHNRWKPIAERDQNKPNAGTRGGVEGYASSAIHFLENHIRDLKKYSKRADKQEAETAKAGLKEVTAMLKFWEAMYDKVTASRPGAKAKMGFVGTAGQAGAIAARGMRDGAAAYRDGKPAVLNRLNPKYHGWSDKDLEVYGNFWMRGWTGEQMKEMRTRDPKQGIDLPGFRSSRPGAKATHAAVDSRTELMLRTWIRNNFPKASNADFNKILSKMLKQYGKDAKGYTYGGGFSAVARDAGLMSRPGAKATAAKPDDKTECSDCETEQDKAGLKLMEKADKAVSDKIRTLIKEGKPQDQAVAIALDMKRRGEL